MSMYILADWYGLLTCQYSYNEAEQKAESADHKVQALENELAEKEQLHEELLEKYSGVQTELDELARQFEDL